MTYSFQLSAVELVSTPREFLKVDTRRESHFAAVDFQDASTSCLIGEGELDLTIETARTEEGGVEDINTICRGNDLWKGTNKRFRDRRKDERKPREWSTYFDSFITAETIELIEKLQHCSLHFTITTLIRIESLGTNRIQFINEDDCWSLLLRQLESITDKLGTITNEHLHQTGACKLKIASIGLSGACTGKKCLPCSWWAIHECTLWWLDPNGLELVRLLHRKNNSFDEFFDLLVEATDISVFLGRPFVDFHGLDT